MDPLSFTRNHQMQRQTSNHLSNGFTSPRYFSSPMNISNILNVPSPKKKSDSPVKSVKNKATQSAKCTCQVSSNGVKETFFSLALLCFVSLFTAFLCLIFLQKTTQPVTTGSEEVTSNQVNSPHLSKGQHNLPNSPHHQSHDSLSSEDVTSTRVSSVDEKEVFKVTQICVSLSTVTISLNLCCLFVSCIQFLSGAKLLKTPQGGKRTAEFFKKTSNTRLAAIASFALSIPIFFTGLVLFVFVNFDEIAAIATSLAIALGIIFCGVACVQTVYLWQDAKTKSTHQLSMVNDTTANSTVRLELSTLV